MKKNLNNKFYIYKHIRLDTNTPFYVGKGCGYRCHHKPNRNKYWKNIVGKCKFKVEIVFENLTEEEAFDMELELIKFYKDQGMCEANISSGGKGGTTGGQTLEHRQKTN